MDNMRLEIDLEKYGSINFNLFYYCINEFNIVNNFDYIKEINQNNIKYYIIFNIIDRRHIMFNALMKFIFGTFDRYNRNINSFKIFINNKEIFYRSEERLLSGEENLINLYSKVRTNDVTIKVKTFTDNIINIYLIIAKQLNTLKKINCIVKDINVNKIDNQYTSIIEFNIPNHMLAMLNCLLTKSKGDIDKNSYEIILLNKYDHKFEFNNLNKMLNNIFWVDFDKVCIDGKKWVED